MMRRSSDLSDWTTANIPDQAGRTAVVTGANTGLGFETALALAGAGAHVVLAVRDLAKGKQAASLLASVREAAEELRTRHAGIHLLINNAGVAGLPKGTTEDGLERHFGTNQVLRPRPVARTVRLPEGGEVQRGVL